MAFLPVQNTSLLKVVTCWVDYPPEHHVDIVEGQGRSQSLESTGMFGQAVNPPQ